MQTLDLLKIVQTLVIIVRCFYFCQMIFQFDFDAERFSRRVERIDRVSPAKYRRYPTEWGPTNTHRACRIGYVAIQSFFVSIARSQAHEWVQGIGVLSPVPR